MITALSHHFYCLAIDLPGHGKTQEFGEPDQYRMPNTAQAIIELLDQLQIETCRIVGYSMGGRLALYLILQFPARFVAGVLESASPGLKTQAEQTQRLQADFKLAEQLETNSFKEFLLTWYHQPLFQTFKTHPHFPKFLERRLENNPHELAKSLRYLGTGCQPSLWEKLKQNTIPLLLLVGEYDHKFKQINSEMAELCALAELQVIPNFGHTIHLENPSEYLTRIKTYFLE